MQFADCYKHCLVCEQLITWMKERFVFWTKNPLSQLNKNNRSEHCSYLLLVPETRELRMHAGIILFAPSSSREFELSAPSNVSMRSVHAVVEFETYTFNACPKNWTCLGLHLILNIMTTTWVKRLWILELKNIDEHTGTDKHPRCPPFTTCFHWIAVLLIKAYSSSSYMTSVKSWPIRRRRCWPVVTIPEMWWDRLTISSSCKGHSQQRSRF